MEQIKATNALAPFLALSKSASSPRAAADLITRATSAPNTFIFAELLATPQIQALSNSDEFSPHLSLLKIFSYGTYFDTVLSTNSLPPLNASQTLKLRQLSILSLAKDPSKLSYANLERELGLTSAREIEDLVISAMYAGLITGTLDPYHQRVNVSSVSPLRDLAPNSIPSMLSTLNEWSTRCVSTLADLEKQIASIKAEAMRRHKENTEWAAHVEKLMEIKTTHSKETSEDNKSSGKGGFGAGLGRILGVGAASKRGSGGLDDDDGMDVDQDSDDDSRDTRSAKKRGGFSGLGFGKS